MDPATLSDDSARRIVENARSEAITDVLRAKLFILRNAIVISHERVRYEHGTNYLPKCSQCDGTLTNHTIGCQVWKALYSREGEGLGR